jgi:hypothetical protein
MVSAGLQLALAMSAAGDQSYAPPLGRKGSVPATMSGGTATVSDGCSKLVTEGRAWFRLIVDLAADIWQYRAPHQPKLQKSAAQIPDMGIPEAVFQAPVCLTSLPCMKVSVGLGHETGSNVVIRSVGEQDTPTVRPAAALLADRRSVGRNRWSGPVSARRTWPSRMYQHIHRPARGDDTSGSQAQPGGEPGR